VSGCNHTGVSNPTTMLSAVTNRLIDRELQLVPKKGRPVTQCQHCRQERKKRSAHVSCDCAQPEKQHHSKEKCIHLREAEDKAKSAGFYHDDGTEPDSAHMARIAEEQGCCCGHGGKCTCALLMKEPDDDSSTPRGPAVKPKLGEATSEGCITQFKNGHHKPVHRKNHAAHECGMPYRIPMPRHHTDKTVSTAARQSVDSLALDTSQVNSTSAFVSTTTTPMHAEACTSLSEQPSLKVPSSAQSCNGGLQDTQLVDVDFSTELSLESATSESFGYPSFDPMTGLPDDTYESFPLYASTSHAALPNNNPFDVWPTSTEHSSMAQPALTAASSGTTSEIDEMPHMDDYMPCIQEDMMSFDFANMPSGSTPELNRRSLPPGFFGNNDFAFTSTNDEWQTPAAPHDDKTDTKVAIPQNRQPTSFDQVWQSNVASTMNTSQRQLGYGLPATSRPQSRSVGPSSAPDEDILKQLFPEIDDSVNMFNNPQMSNFKLANGMTIPSFGPMDEIDTEFTPQPFSDGALSMTTDMITSACDLDQDFSTQDFPTWPQ